LGITQIYANFFLKVINYFWIPDIREMYVKLFTNVIKLFIIFFRKKYKLERRLMEGDLGA
jgi:hypothetical protein